MKIYIDADACPKPIKEILLKAAIRTQCATFLVANKSMHTPKSPFITTVQVASGFDQADKYIEAHVEPSDLVITADIPLANDVIEKGAIALSPRGDLFTADNIKERLMLRDFMSDMRSSGVNTGGPPALNKQDIQKFANALDRYLTKWH